MISRLYLGELEDPPPTLLDYLVARFPHVSREAWTDRVARGAVTLRTGDTVGLLTPYAPGETLQYSREVLGEPGAETAETLIHQDEDLIVADKPHGMPVTPAGPWVERSLLARLQRRTGNPDLVPAHRLDRDTAGLVLLNARPETRGAWHRLFAERIVEREYRALARVVRDPGVHQWRVENRIGRGVPWFRQAIVPGPPNALTLIRLMEVSGGIGLFIIRPESGKKHQIRLHMASIGYAILGDRYYPELSDTQVDTPPLQLLAGRLSFPDPRDNRIRSFLSEQRLDADVF